MAFGLQTFDANGNTILDTTKSTGRVLGVATLTAGVDGSVSDSDFTKGTPFWFCFPNNAGTDAFAPAVSFASTTLSWTWLSGVTSTNHNLVYGVY